MLGASGLEAGLGGAALEGQGLTAIHRQLPRD
jgi:hypothetical protein